MKSNNLREAIDALYDSGADELTVSDLDEMVSIIEHTGRDIEIDGNIINAYTKDTLATYIGELS